MAGITTLASKVRGWHIFCIIIIFVLHTSLGQKMFDTCSGLDQFIANTNQSLTTCTRDSDCSVFTCRTQGTFAQMINSSELTLQPCTDPPSIRLLVNAPGGNIISDEVLNSSGFVFLARVPSSQSVIIVVELAVTLDRNITCELGIEISLMQSIEGIDMTSLIILNSFTSIPLNTSSCVSQTCPPLISSTMSSQTTDYDTDVNTTSSLEPVTVLTGKSVGTGVNWRTLISFLFISNLVSSRLIFI